MRNRTQLSNGIAPALAFAVVLNGLIVIGEALAGIHANSLALAADALHNCSDELALVLLYLSYSRSRAGSARLNAIANGLNSFGILTIAVALVFLALSRLGEPPEVVGSTTMIAGFAAALGNLGVAALLRQGATASIELRLAYLHNLGDVALCLSTAVSGFLIVIFGANWLDCIFAVIVALMLTTATARELMTSTTPIRRGARATSL